MDAVLDSSTLISLAWSGGLELLERAPLTLVVPAEVIQETVTDGLDLGHADAAAIETATKALVQAEPAGGRTADEAVLRVGLRHGMVITNDAALGRRAANLSVRWLRTADLVVLCVRTGRISEARGVAAVRALRSAGRLTDTLTRAHLEELG